MNPLLTGALALLLAGCGASEPAADTTLVISSDPELRKAVAALLPELVERSGLELRDPVRVERRSREELERYLVAKLDEEMPPAREERLTRSYALMGLVPRELDLRELLLSVYTEQVAGFYDPDSTALFVLDDMPPEMLTPLLVHELVHAVQDQATDLDSLTSDERGNDRQAAAQAAIEGHATLVMFELMTEQMRGGAVDLSEVADLSARMRPALEAMRSQYPALANAPAVIRESVLFPYIEGAGFVQRLWAAREGRPAPFGEDLPLSTEQILRPERFLGGPGERDDPTGVVVEVPGREVLYEDGLGQFETAILLKERVGPDADEAARGWDGDRFVLLARSGGDGDADGSADDRGEALVWASVWDDVAARDRFVQSLRQGLDDLPAASRLDPVDVDGRPGAVLRVGVVDQAVEVSLAPVGGR